MYEIKQIVLEDMIKKCYCGGMFPSIILTQKNGYLFSIQREDEGRSLRLFKWNNFSDEQIIPGSVEFDVKQFLRVFKVLNMEKSYIEFLPEIEMIDQLTIAGEEELSDINEMNKQKEIIHENCAKIDREVEVLKTKSKKNNKQKEITLKEQDMENLEKQMQEIDEKITKMEERQIKRYKQVEITNGGKFHIINGKREAFIPYREPEKEVKKKLPFEIKDGVPHVGKGKIPLNTCVNFTVNDLKELCKNISATGTKYVTFDLSDNFSMTAGDLYDISSKIRLVVDCSYSGPKNVNAVYTYGFHEIANTFDKTVHLCFSNKLPAWFYENSKNHVLGIFLAPYLEQED